MTFMFEDLTVYKKSMDFVESAYKVVKSMPEKEIKDQLKRAALSIPLNIAEGNGRIHSREKKQYFYTARGSLLECVSILQLCVEIDQIDKSDYEKLYLLAEQIGKMLSGLIKSVGD